jgi:phosphoribosylglycinamide formyltransferase 1
MSEHPLRLAVMASGNGTNFQAIAEACADGSLDARVVGLVSDKRTAHALVRAEALGIQTHVLAHGPDRDDFATRLIATLEEMDVDLICLAGFMRILSPRVVRRFPNRMINIHPSLLPAYRGLHAIEQAMTAGVAETGVTVHVVDEDVDTGPILLQERVPIHPGDTLESLTARIHEIEHHLYPQAIARYAAIVSTS